MKKLKLDLPNHLERGALSNRFRAHAIRQRKLAADRSKASIRVELEAEADYYETLAQRLDDGDEGVTNERDPIRVDSRRDIDAVDEPKTNGGARDGTG